MRAFLVRSILMAVLLAAGYLWLRPARETLPELALRFTEVASETGCQNHHTMVKLSDRFANIMPWLSSVGAAVAAGDYDGDGFADLYVTNSGAGDPNRLYHNLRNGTFEEVAAQAGVDRPGGASMHSVWGDLDNDGDLDLYVTKWAAPNTLYENRGGGVFADITERAGVGYWGYGNGATFLDYDRDGHLDLLVGNYFAAEVEDPATGKRVRNDLWNPVTTRVMHETFTHAANGGKDVLYRNHGNGTFTNVIDEAGLHFNGWTLAVGSTDLNNDSWPDIYIANDFGPDELYFSTGAVEDPPRFRAYIDGSGHPGIGADWWKGMNVDFGDVDGNGYFDIYVTNILAHRYKTDEGNMLWLNLADPRAPGGRGFRNVAPESGVDDGGWGWGAVFADFDLDGLLDIFAVNGFVTGDPERTYWYQLQEMVTQTKNQAADAADWPPMGDRDLCGYERSRLFIQHPSSKQPDGAASGDVPQFAEVAERAGIDDFLNGRGVAVFDLENDGDLDIYVANQGAPSCLYRNELRGTDHGSPHWVGLELVGRPELPPWIPKRPLATTTGAVGARVELLANGRRQVRDVPGGRGFASQSSPRLCFGLGDGPVTIQELKITWPSGRKQSIATPGLTANLLDRTTRWVEPEALELDSLMGRLSRPRLATILSLVAVALIAGFAIYKRGLLGLPPVPAGTTLGSSGLAGLDSLAAEAAAIARKPQADDERDLADLRAALEGAPSDLVIGNAYRMTVLRLVRQHLGNAAAMGELARALPAYLEGEPIATLDRLRREHPSREATLQLALAWVDEMLLYPALEIKAPASVESVELLTQIIEGSDPSYVPALYARGLNYLHRPARLVWPEERKAAADAASRDLGTAVAIGRHLDVGSPRLKATLGLALGDAYAKEGRGGVARSWWQIARAASADTAIRAAADRRFGWGDGELLDRLETELEARMLDLDPPMTDLSIMWSGGQ